MEPREGHSRDYDTEKRQYIYDTYKEMIGEHTLTEIAHRLGMTVPTFYTIRKTNWWAEKALDDNQ